MFPLPMVNRYWLVAATCLIVGVVQAQEAPPRDSTATGKGRGPFMLELSFGRTKMPGITNGGGPGTAAVGIGTGKWFADRVMIGLEARAHGTVDIEPSVPSVRFVSGVLAMRRTPGEPVLRLGVGPAWVGPPNSRLAARTVGYSASLEIPFEPDLREGSLVLFLRYSGTGNVATPPSRPAPFRTTQFALGLRLEL